MREACSAARTLLADAARRLGMDAGAVPLRLDRERGALVSALARKLAGGDDVALAQALAREVPAEEPFSRVEAVGSMLVLTLSERWMRETVRRFACVPWPDAAPRHGVRRCDKTDDAFLLDYTARRCRRLEQGQGAWDGLPRRLVCLLAEERVDAPAAARAFWALPPRIRRDRELARAVGICAAVFTKNSPEGPSGALS